MKKSFFKPLFVIAVFSLGLATHLHAQVNVGLDNWFNRETRDNGKPFHYLWTDTTFSGYSQWGKIFTGKGAKLSTLEKPVANVLQKVDIYIIVDPDTTKENSSPNYIEADDINNIRQWVKNGGILMLLANDAPNCEFTHLNNLSGKFSIIFNHVSLHPVINRQWEMGAFDNLPDHPVFQGVRKIYMKEISSLRLSGNAKPILVENDIVFMAESRYGKGLVIAVGDPWIYNEYIDHALLSHAFENKKAAERLTDYLISQAQKEKK